MYVPVFCKMKDSGTAVISSSAKNIVGTPLNLPTIVSKSSVTNKLYFLLLVNLNNLHILLIRFIPAPRYVGMPFIFLPCGKMFVYFHPSFLTKSSSTSFDVITISTSCPRRISSLIVIL